MSRNARSWTKCCAVLFAVLVGCAQNYHKEYLKANPEWDGVFPTLGASVEETLAGLDRPGGSDFGITRHDLALFRIDGAQWEGVLIGDVLGRGGALKGSYALAVHRSCRSRGGDVFVHLSGNEWFLFSAGRLVAYDAREYGTHCFYIPYLVPASEEMQDAERRVRQSIRESFPNAINEPRIGFYYRGFLYARAERLPEAEELLASGDASSVGAEDIRMVKVDSERSRILLSDLIPDKKDERTMRRMLELEIRRLRKRQESLGALPPDRPPE